MHIPRPFWELFSQYDLSCLMLVGKVTTCILSNLVLSEAWITTFYSRLHRWDKLLLWCESPPIHLVYLCTLSHFWHPLVGSTQRRRIPDLVWQWELGQSHDHPLNCQAWWFLEVSDYLSPKLEVSPCLTGSHISGI